MDDRPMPDVVKAMSKTAHLNTWGCWVQDMPENLLDDWGWISGGEPKAHGWTVLTEIDRNCMVELDVGQDGVPVVTFGLFEFECPMLHASLFDLVEDFVDSRAGRDGRIEEEDADYRAEALRLALALEQAAGMLRKALMAASCPEP